MQTDGHVTESLPAYALDCLGEADAVPVSEHLAVCDDCRAELRAYQSVVDDLAVGLPAVEPPPGLRSQLMDRIQNRPMPSAGTPRTTWWGQLTGLMRRNAPAWGLASLVLITALVIGNLWLLQQLSRPMGGTEAKILQTITLAGTELAPQATGLIVISSDGEHGTLIVDSLAPLGQDQQYQLWLIQDGKRASGGIFSVNPDGYGSLWVESLQPLINYSAFGITIEPAGGSPGPTGEKVLGSTL